MLVAVVLVAPVVPVARGTNYVRSQLPYGLISEMALTRCPHFRLLSRNLVLGTGKHWVGLRASHGIIASCAAVVRTTNKDGLGIAPFSPDRQQRRPVT